MNYLSTPTPYGEQAIKQANYAREIEHSPTVEENIDHRINFLKNELARLEQSKIDLQPLLKMRIRDIRSAMDY
jgi:hypothetical protein